MSTKSPARRRTENAVPAGADAAELEFFMAKPKLARTPLKSVTNTVPTASPAKPPMNFRMSSSKPNTPLTKSKSGPAGSEKKEKRDALSVQIPSTAASAAPYLASVSRSPAARSQQPAFSTSKPAARSRTPTKASSSSSAIASRGRGASSKTTVDATAASARKPEVQAPNPVTVAQTATAPATATADPATAVMTAEACSAIVGDVGNEEEAEDEAEDARTISFIEQLLERKLKPDEFRKLARELRSPSSRRSSFAAAARRRSSLGVTSGVTFSSALATVAGPEVEADGAGMKSPIVGAAVASASRAMQRLSMSPSCGEIIDELRCVLSAFIDPAATPSELGAMSPHNSAAASAPQQQQQQGAAVKVSYKFKGFGAAAAAAAPATTAPAPAPSSIVAAHKGPKVVISRSFNRKSISHATAAAAAASATATATAGPLSPMVESLPEDATSEPADVATVDEVDPFQSKRSLRRSPVPAAGASKGTPGASSATAASARRNVMSSAAFSDLQKTLNGATGAVTSISRRTLPTKMQVEEAIMNAAAPSPAPVPVVATAPALSPPPRSAARSFGDKSPAARRTNASGAKSSARRPAAATADAAEMLACTRVKTPLVKHSPPIIAATASDPAEVASTVVSPSPAAASSGARSSGPRSGLLSGGLAKGFHAVNAGATSANDAALTERLVFLEGKLSQSLESFDQYKAQSALEIEALKQSKLDNEILVCREHLEKLSAAQFMLEQKEMLRVERRARMRAEVAIALLSTKLTESIDKISELVATSTKAPQNGTTHAQVQMQLEAVVEDNENDNGGGNDECTAAIMSMADDDDLVDPEVANKSVSKSLIAEFETADNNHDNGGEGDGNLFDHQFNTCAAAPEHEQEVAPVVKKQLHCRKATASSSSSSLRSKVQHEAKKKFVLNDPLGFKYSGTHNARFIPVKSGVAKVKPYGDSWTEREERERGDSGSPIDEGEQEHVLEAARVKKEKVVACGKGKKQQVQEEAETSMEQEELQQVVVEKPMTVAQRAAASARAASSAKAGSKSRGSKKAAAPVQEQDDVETPAPTAVAKDSKKRKKEVAAVAAAAKPTVAAGPIGFSPISKAAAAAANGKKASEVDEESVDSSAEDEAEARKFLARHKATSKSVLKTKAAASQSRKATEDAELKVCEPPAEAAEVTVAPTKKMAKGKGRVVPAATVAEVLPDAVTAPITMTLAQKLANAADQDLFSPTRSPPKKKKAGRKAAAPAPESVPAPVPEEAPVAPVVAAAVAALEEAATMPKKKGSQKATGAAKGKKQPVEETKMVQAAPVVERPPAVPVSAPVAVPAYRPSLSLSSSNSSMISSHGSFVSGMVPMLKPKGALIVPKLKARK